MKYINAEEVLPRELLYQIQQYIQGNLIYIPKYDNREKWGEKTGAKRIMFERNNQIISMYENGYNIKEISKKYYLSEHTIRKIINKSR
ncbi:CD3324 family protein [Clostridium aquiflavi]|uniref:CD3324 family protein n=1 Tax=Clostridium aquiflavi TaxID=3073603 RepID=A0ABU1EEH9_9CLOT|nr:CD3324 family protein [Clostridium sp. 5N-1]MDR5586795.1 CD3324 family protein [Clostridium sp. 5N-1]